MSDWISVKDRLPEDLKRVRVYAPVFGITDGYLDKIKMDRGYKECWRLVDATCLWKVTHWMPLPEPPK